MSRNEYVVLVEHTRAAAHILDDIRAIGLRVLYLGKDPVLQDRADRFIDLNPVIDLEHLIEHHLEELRELPLAGTLTFSEHQKFAEQRLASALGFPTLSPETLQLGRDKYEMRRRMLDAGISVPRFAFLLDSQESPSPPLEFPFIIKPNLGFSSAGVQLVRTPQEFESALRTIRMLNRFALKKMAEATPGALCEEYIDGPEFSVDSITVGGRTVSFTTCGREFPGGDNFQDYVYFTPPRIDLTMQAELEGEVERLVAVFGYRDGPTHTEVRYDRRRGRWVVLETAWRVGFGGNIGLVCKAATGVEYNQLAIRSALGRLSIEELLQKHRVPTRHAILFTPVTGKGGVVSRIGGEDLLEKDSRIFSHCLLKQKGQAVVPYPKSVEYLGYVLGVTQDENEIRQLTREIAEKVVYYYEEN